ncbi:hypothetical protein RR46_03093 [Papilio xuthus]|uniref:Uncharacterized protein n=1 Tax=Papilio xuthus TaxID=66420 RepID=A0A194Q6Q2_PAPXU|nr:hypothetical protein RR46_03093 [Papilio xuthus]
MSWLNLNQSFNSLKGQITNFASEVLSENAGDDVDSEETGISSSFKELEDKCNTQQLEIAALKKLNEELQATLQNEMFLKVVTPMVIGSLYVPTEGARRLT